MSVSAVRFSLDVPQCCNKSSFALMQGIGLKWRGNFRGAGKAPRWTRGAGGGAVGQADPQKVQNAKMCSFWT
jgi:hypothetical protein